ncbi:hypothetical protein MLD38_016215 [Melastoma candidum]|uniref:Uncharacterized protein n=1 Tax=Melastoma candidum TaxID=119954 RepID=A0ACB9RME1_9MYRT|nr:hypothetical protein MLD38_016215 [Melastoma candidum]
MGRMVQQVYQRRRKPQKTRNISELINLPQRQEQHPQQALDANHSNAEVPPRSSSPRQLTPEECNYELLLSMLRRKDTQGFFAKPVDANEVEFYYETIEEPMDFGTIGKKIDKGKYQSIQQFERDVMLVFDNAMLFNDADTVYYRKALMIKEVAQKLFHALKGDPDNFQDKFFGSKRVEPKKRTKANVRQRAPKVAKEESTGRKRPEAGPAQSRVPPMQRRYTYYNSEKSSSGAKNGPVLMLPEFDCPKILVQQPGDYKRSLLRFTKGLGAVAQRVAMRKLQQLEQEEERLRNLTNMQQQYPAMGTVVAPAATTAPNLSANTRKMSNVGNQSSLLLRSSSGTATPTATVTYPMSMSSVNWRLNPPTGSQDGFLNSIFQPSSIWNGDRSMFQHLPFVGDGKQLPLGLNHPGQHFQSGDQARIKPTLNYLGFIGKTGGGQGSLSNSNYSGHGFQGRSLLNLPNLRASRPEHHWGNQTNLPTANFTNVNPQGSNFPYQNLSSHNGIGDETSFPTVNSSRKVHNHPGGQLNQLDQYFPPPVMGGDDQGFSQHSNLSGLLSQISGNQLNTSSPNEKLYFSATKEQNKEDYYLPEGLPRQHSKEGPGSSNLMTPPFLVGPANIGPFIDNEPGIQGTISWMDYVNMDSPESHGLGTGTHDAGAGSTHALEDMFIPPEIFNRPFKIKDPQPDSRSWLQPQESGPGEAVQTSLQQGQGRSSNEQETEDQIRKRKGKGKVGY